LPALYTKLFGVRCLIHVGTEGTPTLVCRKCERSKSGGADIELEDVYGERYMAWCSKQHALERAQLPEAAQAAKDSAGLDWQRIRDAEHRRRMRTPSKTDVRLDPKGAQEARRLANRGRVQLGWTLEKVEAVYGEPVLISMSSAHSGRERVYIDIAYGCSQIVARDPEIWESKLDVDRARARDCAVTVRFDQDNKVIYWSDRMATQP
jgi:hypothetical protein